MIHEPGDLCDIQAGQFGIVCATVDAIVVDRVVLLLLQLCDTEGASSEENCDGFGVHFDCDIDRL